MNGMRKIFITMVCLMTVSFFLLLGQWQGLLNMDVSANSQLKRHVLTPSRLMKRNTSVGKEDIVFRMPSQDKVSSKQSCSPVYRDEEVLVSFKKGVSIQDIDNMLSKLKLTKGKRFSTLSKIKGKEYALVRGKGKKATELFETLKHDPSVEAVSMNYSYEFYTTCEGTFPNDPAFGMQWPLCNNGQPICDPYGCFAGTPDSDIDATEAWDIQRGSEDVIVVVMDTGVDYTHPDLMNNMWINQDEAGGTPGVDDDLNGYIDDIYGVDTGEDDSDPADFMGHGTHIAGIIAAEADNGEGISGINWNARIMAVKVATADMGLYTDDVLDAIDYVILMKDKGVNIVAINASWGGPFYEQILKDAIEAAGEKGIIFVAAAGNGSADNDLMPAYPASYDLPNIISVAATDMNDNLSFFSNYGATSVDLGAPGEFVYSTFCYYFYVPGLGNELFFDNIESVSGNWTAEEPWEIVEIEYEIPPYGTFIEHVWSDSPDGDYENNTYSALTSREIDISDAQTPLALGFSIEFDLEFMCDWLDVYFKAPFGWVYMGGITGASDPGWFYIFNVPILEDFFWEEFQVKFVLFSDSANTFDGVFLDNIGIGTPVKEDILYTFMDGTSMAAPHVAGAAALIAAEHPAEDMDKRINRILSGVDPLPSLAGKVATGGRLNLYNSLVNLPPDCSNAHPSIEVLWPPDNRMAQVGILGITDPDGDEVDITITGITSDEPTGSSMGTGEAMHSPDASGVGTDLAMLRVERSGNGNGRVYEISFTVSDPMGSECSGSITVCVPHDLGPDGQCIDDGQIYDATVSN